MGSRARAPLARLADALDAPVANQTALGTLLRALSALRNNASAATSAADNLRRPLSALNLDAFIKVLSALSLEDAAIHMSSYNKVDNNFTVQQFKF